MNAPFKIADKKDGDAAALDVPVPHRAPTEATTPERIGAQVWTDDRRLIARRRSANLAKTHCRRHISRFW